MVKTQAFISQFIRDNMEKNFEFFWGIGKLVYSIMKKVFKKSGEVK